MKKMDDSEVVCHNNVNSVNWNNHKRKKSANREKNVSKKYASADTVTNGTLNLSSGASANSQKKKKRKNEIKINLKNKHSQKFVQIIADPECLISAPDIFQNNQIENQQQQANFSFFDKLNISSGYFGARFSNSVTEEQLMTLPNSSDQCKNLESSPWIVTAAERKEQLSSVSSIDDRTEKTEGVIRKSPKQPRPSVTNGHQLNKVRSVDSFQLADSNDFILVLHHPCTLKFFGKLTVSVLAGEVEMLGYKLNCNSNSSKVNAFSTFVSSVNIQTNILQAKPDKLQLEEKLRNLNLSKKQANEISSSADSNDSVLLLKKLDAKFLQVIKKYSNSTIFPSTSPGMLQEASKALKCIFDFRSGLGLRDFRKNPDWDEVSIKKVTVICGGSHVGKSTLLRYLVNKKLSTCKSVLCLDFDPGQSEFTAPGCISAFVVQEPLLGANFSHVLHPERMVFLGEVNVSQCPKSYLECVASIIKYCRQKSSLQELNWFVNTMGFCKGIGVSLMISVLRLLRPDTLIQIKSTDMSRNFPFNLDSECLRSSEAFDFPTDDYSDVTYDYFGILSCTDSGGGTPLKSSFKPKDLRDLMNLSYFSQMTAAPFYNFNAVQPYSIPFVKLFLGVNALVSPNDILRAFNGSMVGLCHFNESSDADVLEAEGDQDFFKIVIKPGTIPCIALGFVRGIDCHKKKVFVATHLTGSALKEVNCLTLGSITAPQCMYLNQSTVEGPVPYTSINTSDNTQGIKRKFRAVTGTGGPR